MQPNVLIHDSIEFSRCTLCLREDLHQKDDFTDCKSIDSILNYLIFECFLKTWQLLHDTRCHIPANDRYQLTFLKRSDIFFNKLLSLDAHHLKCHFLPTLTYLVMFCYWVHDWSEIQGCDACETVGKDFVKDFEKLILWPQMLKREGEKLGELFVWEVRCNLRGCEVLRDKSDCVTS